jgi:hypothetical protein
MATEGDKGTEVRRVNLDDIEDGDIVAVIVEERGQSGMFHVAGYADGKAVPHTVEQAKYGLVPLRTACVCGEVDLRYAGYSHKMPDVHPWPTLIYRCAVCGRTLSFLRLTADDARRAMVGGFGTQPDSTP